MRDLSEKVSHNFTRGEFEVAESEVTIHPRIVMAAQKCRSAYGMRLYITSGVRTPEHNAKVGGSIRSSHLAGLACDISDNNLGREMSGLARYIIISELTALGITRIGIAKTFIHFDVDESKRQEVIWLY